MRCGALLSFIATAFALIFAVGETAALIEKDRLFTKTVSVVDSLCILSHKVEDDSNGDRVGVASLLSALESNAWAHPVLPSEHISVCCWTPGVQCSSKSNRVTSIHFFDMFEPDASTAFTTYVPSETSLVSHLETLSLGLMLIDHVENNALSGLMHLTELVLNDNNITSLLFELPQSLQSLDMDRNSILSLRVGSYLFLSLWSYLTVHKPHIT